MKRKTIETAIKYTREWADLLDGDGNQAGANYLRRGAQVAEDDIDTWRRIPYEVVWRSETATPFDRDELERQLAEDDVRRISAGVVVLFPPGDWTYVTPLDNAASHEN